MYMHRNEEEIKILSTSDKFIRAYRIIKSF